MQEVYVNGEEFDKAEDVWEYLKEELGLEAGDVGGLYDALTELSDDTKITIDMSQVADDDLLDEVMEEAAGESDYLEVVCIE